MFALRSRRRLVKVSVQRLSRAERVELHQFLGCAVAWSNARPPKLPVDISVDKMWGIMTGYCCEPFLR